MDEKRTNFIWDLIDADLADGHYDHVHTRFPPEPNGYLHIGSAKAIWINAETAKHYGGHFNLRYDDTNPAHEDMEYVDSILEDLRWLGANPDGGIFYGSDYFEKCYEFAVKLIRAGKAYVCSLSAEQMRALRGTLTQPGVNSPDRNRSVEENLILFEQMKSGAFENGQYTLRAKIDMSSPNMNMRDPAIYRIMHAEHHRQGNTWCIYPLYDFAHPIQDALEGITHSLCSIEFENHRPLYEWVLENVGDFHPVPKQREFARLNVTYTVMSKRYLRQLVETGVVDGWDDPRMPTLCGLRRRGYTPASVIEFVKTAGVSKALSNVDIGLLEHCIRNELNQTALRRMAVTDPVEVEITNLPPDHLEYFEVANNPNDTSSGCRKIAFGNILYIERSDFCAVPPSKFFRLSPGKEVRLMGSYIIRCDDFVLDDSGNVTRILCSADLTSGGTQPSDGRKVKGTIHWVSARHSFEAELRVYDRLFTLENVADIPEDRSYGDYLNPNSIHLFPHAKLEMALQTDPQEQRFQFVRNGYYIRDSRTPSVFNSIVALKDTWAKIHH